MVSLRQPPRTHGRLPSDSHCNKCGGVRTHQVLNEHKTTWDDYIGDGRYIGGSDWYFVIQCAGCGSIHFRHDSTFSEDTDADGDPVVRVQFFPPAYARRRPEWLASYDGPFWIGGHPIRGMLDEIYVALQNSLPRLSAMGIRALVEYIMVDKVGDQGSFAKNVDAFFGTGLLAPAERDVFKNSLLEVGHAAMHRNHVPPAQDLELLMDIVEPIVFNLYVRPDRIANLAPVPPRP